MIGLSIERWKQAGWKQARGFVSSLRFIPIVALQFLLVAASVQGQAGPAEAQRQSLGSLMAAGEVYVNEMSATSELTIYPGDSVRTGATGTAVLLTVTNGSYQISPSSQVVFAGDPRYVAELKSGSLLMKSTSGPGKDVVRVGDFVVVPTVLNSQTVEKIEKMADGSFLITCSLGNIGVVPMQGAQGLFLQGGQSARITANNELVAVEQPRQIPSKSQASPQATGRSNRTWIFLGVVGGGAAGLAAWAATRGSSPPVVSPTAP